MTSPEKLATPEIISFSNWFVSDAAHAPAQPDEPSDFPARLAQRAWLAAKSAVLATQRQGEGENRKIAQLIIDNDRAGAVKWATGLIGNFDGPSCRIDPDATSQGVAVAQPDAPPCETCNGNGMIGGPCYREPDEGGVPCPDCGPAGAAQGEVN